MSYVSKAIVFMALLALQGATQGQSFSVVIFPNDAVIKLPTGKYGLTLCPGLCPVLENQVGVAVLSYKDVGRTVCAVDEQQGTIYVSAGLTRRAQAKVLIHEVVHTAVDCDLRDLPIDEKIAQALAALTDSSAGIFVLEALK